MPLPSLCRTSTEMLTLHFMECQRQENTRDCGLFAIANAMELAFNRNPSTVGYASGDIMQFRLVAWFEVKQTDPFPRTGVVEHKNRIALSQMVLHCSCIMPENEEIILHAVCAKSGFTQLVMAWPTSEQKYKKSGSCTLWSVPLIWKRIRWSELDLQFLSFLLSSLPH